MAHNKLQDGDIRDGDDKHDTVQNAFASSTLLQGSPPPARGTSIYVS